MKVTMKAGHLASLLETYSLPAGNKQLFPILPLTFSDEGITCKVQSEEKTSIIWAKWAPSPYTIEDASEEPTYISVPDFLPILKRFGQDEVITLDIDNTITLTGQSKQIVHHPESNLTAVIPAKLPDIDSEGRMITKGGPATSFFTFDATIFHDVMEDAKVIDADTYPITLDTTSEVRLGSDESKSDQVIATLKGKFDGEPSRFLLGAEFAYLMKNMKGNMTMQCLPKSAIMFTIKSTKPAGQIYFFIAPRLSV